MFQIGRSGQGRAFGAEKRTLDADDRSGIVRTAGKRISARPPSFSRHIERAAQNALLVVEGVRGGEGVLLEALIDVAFAGRPALVDGRGDGDDRASGGLGNPADRRDLLVVEVDDVLVLHRAHLKRRNLHLRGYLADAFKVLPELVGNDGNRKISPGRLCSE